MTAFIALRGQVIYRSALFIAAVTLNGSSTFASTWNLSINATSPAEVGHEIRLLEKDDNDIVIKTEELPQAVRDYVAKEMPDSKITEARKDFKGNKEKKGNNFTYEVDVKQGSKEYELRFSPDGKLLKKRENAGDDAADKV